MLDRRSFLTATAGAAICTAFPVAVRAAPVVAPAAQTLKWFAIGHTDDFCHPIRAYTMRQAIEEYALEHEQTKGSECPDCGEFECLEHLTKAQWDDPLPHMEEYSCEPKAWAGLEGEPTNAQWAEAGFNTKCDCCMDVPGWWEPVSCRPHHGKALCDDCYFQAVKTHTI